MPDDYETSAELANFGKYLLDEELARGGMSRVFRARLQGPGGFEKKLVVKQILPELARDPAFIELFVREAKTLVQMSHPNLVPVYELGVIDGVYFLAMEWVEGATVAELLHDGPLPEASVAQIGAQIADALRYAHERFQIVHRDVTPRNIIVDGAGHARLLDFGIAAAVEHTGTGELFGSPGYMSPEQARGETLGPESDLYSLGCVLYEALSGKAAFTVTRAADGGYSASELTPKALEQIDPTLTALIEQLLARERAKRPASAGEVADALRTWVATHHPRGVPPADLAERTVRAHVRRSREPRPLSNPPPASSSGRIEVRSIAVSPELTELLSHQTERIERAPPIPTMTPITEEMANDPEMKRVARRFFRDIVVIMMALTAALVYAEHTAKKDAEVAAALAARAMSEPAPAAATVAAVPGDAPPSVSAPAGTAPSPGNEPPAGTAPSPGSAPNTVDPRQPTAAPRATDPLQPGATSLPGAPQPTAAPRASDPLQTGATALPRAPQPSAAPRARDPLAPGATALPGAPQPSAAPLATDATAKKPGFLTVSASPWAEVRVDGRLLGVTPQRTLPLRAGKHVVTLSCPPLDREARVPIDLQAGQDLHVGVDLHATPPDVSVH